MTTPDEYSAIRTAKRIKRSATTHCVVCDHDYPTGQFADAYHEYRVDRGTGFSDNDPCYAVICPEGHSAHHGCRLTA